MATTTNYGWTTPNDTDLVKDGASAIRTLGQSIDTTFAELKGGTSGQMLTKASNTDLDLVWVTPQIGDITSITATSPLTGGGTTGDVTVGIQAGSTTQSGALQLTDSTSSTSTTTAATPNSVKTSYDLANAAIAKSTVTTAGDIIYRNATVPTRLGIGTAGQVLTVNSGATAPEWATASSGGGQTLLSTTSLSGATTTVTIAGGYKDLKVVVYGCTNATAGGRFRIAPNGTTNITCQTGTGVANGTSVYNNYIQLGYIQTFDNPTYTDATNVYELEIFDYTSTTARKVHRFTNFYQAGGPNFNFENWGGAINTTSAITSLVFSNAGGNYSTGTVLVYGVS